MRECDTKIPFSITPLLPILVGIILGVVIGFNLEFWWIVFAIVGIVLTYFSKQKTTTLIFISVVLGWVNVSFQSPNLIDDSHLNKTMTFSGVASSIKTSDEIRSIILDIDTYIESNSINTISPIKSVVYIPSLNPIIEHGDRVTFIGTLSKINDNRDLPDEFDIAKYYSHNGIYTSSFIQPEKIHVSSTNNSLFYKIQNFRDDITHLIASLPISSGCIEFLNTTITGDTSMLTDEQRLKYSTSGLAHILALSGLHIGIISLFILLILFPIDIFGWRKTRYIITILLLWLYAIITGLSPSVTRSVIMATTYLIAQIIQRHHSPYNSLCLAAIIILIFDPYSIFDIGFQLSFIAVVTILIFADKINPIARKNKILYSICSICCISIAAMIGTGIVSAYYFHSLPLYFLFANIISSYILPLIIIGGVIAIISTLFGIEPNLLCYIIDFLYSIINNITDVITSLPGAGIGNIYFSSWIFIPYFISIICLGLALYFKKRFWYYNTGIFIFITITLCFLCKPKHCKTEYFIPRDTYYTNLIIRDSTTLYLLSTARGGYFEQSYNNCLTKYNDYMGKRGVDSFIIIPQQFNSNCIHRNYSSIIIGTDEFAIINNNKLDYIKRQPKYALVCNGFKGNILDVSNIVNPDTIILSNDLHKKRHLRYIDSCVKHNIPHISLREKGFHKVVQN